MQSAFGSSTSRSGGLGGHCERAPASSGSGTSWAPASSGSGERAPAKGLRRVGFDTSPSSDISARRDGLSQAVDKGVPRAHPPNATLPCAEGGGEAGSTAARRAHTPLSFHTHIRKKRLRLRLRALSTIQAVPFRSCQPGPRHKVRCPSHNFCPLEGRGRSNSLLRGSTDVFLAPSVVTAHTPGPAPGPTPAVQRRQPRRGAPRPRQRGRRRRHPPAPFACS